MSMGSCRVYGIIDVVIEFAIFNNNVVCIAGIIASPVVMEFTVARSDSEAQRTKSHLPYRSRGRGLLFEE